MTWPDISWSVLSWPKLTCHVVMFVTFLMTCNDFKCHWAELTIQISWRLINCYRVCMVSFTLSELTSIYNIIYSKAVFWESLGKYVLSYISMSCLWFIPRETVFVNNIWFTEKVPVNMFSLNKQTNKPQISFRGQLLTIFSSITISK